MTNCPAGIFTIEQDFDSKYVITSIDFARDLLMYDRELSLLEIKLDPNSGFDPQVVQDRHQRREVDDRRQCSERERDRRRVLLYLGWQVPGELGEEDFAEAGRVEFPVPGLVLEGVPAEGLAAVAMPVSAL